MRRSERSLLNNLRGKEKITSEQPLSNIKNSLGSLRHVKGNPLTKTEIALEVSVAYRITPAGAIIAPAALPAQLQTTLPVFMFGLTDFYSGYPAALSIQPIGLGWNLANLFGAPKTGIIGYTGMSQPAYEAAFGDRWGDFICIFRSVAIGGIVYEARIRIRCNNVAYGTFLNSFVSDLITLDSLRYFVPLANINQLDNSFTFAHQSLFGKLNTDSIDPRMYSRSINFNSNIVDIPLNLPLNKNMIMTFNLNFDCQTVNFVLFVQKVEPLTNALK